MAVERINVVSYDPLWPKLFAEERRLLERVLAPWLAGGVHHIGSTAVPGLAAKSLIDIIAGVRDLQESRAAYEPLGEVGYVYAPHRPRGAHHFAKPSVNWWERTRNLHLTEVGSGLWRERLAFRDALRESCSGRRVRGAEAAFGGPVRGWGGLRGSQTRLR